MEHSDDGPPKAVSKYMAELGRRGGAATGDSKRRGGADHYRRVAEARWGKKRKRAKR